MRRFLLTGGGRLVARACGALIGALIAIAVIAVWPSGASASTPYSDPSSKGYMTLYDTAGKAIKTGRITDKPFVGKAVSSQAAPAPYDAAGRKATLFAFQPRNGVNPGDWNGDK